MDEFISAFVSPSVLITLGLMVLLAWAFNRRYTQAVAEADLKAARDWQMRYEERDKLLVIIRAESDLIKKEIEDLRIEVIRLERERYMKDRYLRRCQEELRRHNLPVPLEDD